MRLLLLLVIVGTCLVSAKYLPDDSSNLQRLVSRQKRSNLEDSSSSSDTEDDSDEDSKDNTKLIERIEKMRQKLLEKQEKEKRKQEEAQKKLEEKIAKELQKEEEKRLKEEEKRAKEERKQEEKLEKERRKLEEQQRKIEEKVHKNEEKRQQILQKQLKEIEEDTLKLQEIESLELETDDSVELEDFWKNYIYSKYGLNDSNSDLEKEAALKRYMQEELGLNANSTASERRRAVLRLVENKLQTVSDHYALQSQLVSFINSVGVQKIRSQLEKEIEEINNKTNILNNVNLPWVPLAKENYAEQVSFLETIKGFLSSILPNWFDANVNAALGPNASGPTNINKPVQNENIKPFTISSSNDGRFSPVDSKTGNGSDNDNVISTANVNNVANGQSSDGPQSSLSFAENNNPKAANGVSEIENSVGTSSSTSSTIPNDPEVDSTKSSFNSDKTIPSDPMTSNVDTMSFATDSYSLNEVDSNGFSNNVLNAGVDLFSSDKSLDLSKTDTSNDKKLVTKTTNTNTDAVAIVNAVPEAGSTILDVNLINSGSSTNSNTVTVKDASISESNITPKTPGSSVDNASPVKSNDNEGILIKTENDVSATSGTIPPSGDSPASVIDTLPLLVTKDTKMNDPLLASDAIKTPENEIAANTNDSPFTAVSTDIVNRLESGGVLVDLNGVIADINNDNKFSSNSLPSNDPLPSTISTDDQMNATRINKLLTDISENGFVQSNPPVKNTVAISTGADDLTGNENSETIAVISADSSIQLAEATTDSNTTADSLKPETVVLENVEPALNELVNQNTVTKNLTPENNNSAASEQILPSSSANVNDIPPEAIVSLNNENSIVPSSNTDAVIAEEVQVTTAGPDGPVVTTSDIAQDSYTNFGETVTDAGVTELPVYLTDIQTELSQVSVLDQSQFNVVDAQPNNNNDQSIVKEVPPSTEQPIVTDILSETAAPTAAGTDADINLFTAQSQPGEGIATPVEYGASLVDVTPQ